MALSTGTCLGPYEVLAPLGAGGMGEVYRARDTRLERDVALKILPPEVADDSSRRQRFEMEARAVAALNHPNIVAIYDVGDGYIVTELVDGESLRGSKFGVRKTLDIAVQIARGLAAAHDAGIVHRDLKPDNIMLTRDGHVKILDFGLAKRHVAAQAAAAETVTMRTEPGVVMGTVGYMSPEQVRGLDADHRSDIFSFGLILYELLAGKRAFNGATSVEIMTAILKEDAPDLPETVPAGVRQIVAHCLEKEPSNRFQSARDLAFALSQFDRPSESSPTHRMPVRMPRAAGISFAVLVAVAAFFAGRILSRAPKPPLWSGVRLGGPEIALSPRVSPDGHLLAFQAMDRGTTQVALMKPESGNWSILTHRRDLGTAYSISWSPDGTKIYYGRFADSKAVYSVPILGGEEHLVLANAGDPEALPDGSLLVIRLNQQGQTQWFRFWPETGRFQDLPLLQTQSLLNAGMARVAPGSGTAVLKAFGIRENAIALYTLDLPSNSVKRITPPGRHDERISGLAMSADGKSVLAAVPAGAVRRVVAYPLDGTAEHDLFTITNDTWYLDQGPDGSVYVSLLDRPAEIVRLSLNGATPETVAAFARLDDLAQVLLLPDGRMVVPEVAGHVRLMAVAPGKEPVPLIQTSEETSAPMTVVGPDRVAFMIGSASHDTIAIADVDSGRIHRKIPPGKGMIDSLAASPDGTTLFFAARGEVWSIPASGGEPREICPGHSALVEPFGRNLVVRRAGIPRLRMYRVPLDGSSEQEIPIDESTPLWDSPVSLGALDRKGRLLASAAPWDSWFNPLVMIDTASGRITRVPANELRDYHSAAWLPDGRIVASQVATRATLWKFTSEPR